MFAKLEQVQAFGKEVFDHPDFVDSLPRRGAALAGFRARVGRAARLALQEPEIAAFALAQWLSVILVYALWAWGARHIELPEELAESLEGWDTLAFTAWTVACLALVSVPVAFFTACIVMVHFLRQEGEDSSLLECIRRTAPRMGPLWGFVFIDVLITAGRWLERMPSRRSRSSAEMAVGEGLYYAWKVASAGMVPSILADRPLLRAAKESADLARRRLAEVMLLRTGYTVATWIVGFAAFAISWWQLREHRELLPDIVGSAFWFWAPAVVALGLVQLALRPVFLLASSEIYHDYREALQRGTEGARSEAPPRPRTNARLSAALSLATVTALSGLIYAAFQYDLHRPPAKKVAPAVSSAKGR